MNLHYRMLSNTTLQDGTGLMFELEDSLERYYKVSYETSWMSPPVVTIEADGDSDTFKRVREAWYILLPDGEWARADQSFAADCVAVIAELAWIIG